MRGQANRRAAGPVLAAFADRHARRQEADDDAEVPGRTASPSRAVLAAVHGHLGTLSLRLEAGRSFRAGVLVVAG